MLKSLLISSALMVSGATLACNRAAASAVAIPDPAIDETIRNSSPKQTIVLAGGCFWGVDAVFKLVKGVTTADAGLFRARDAMLEPTHKFPIRLRPHHEDRHFAHITDAK